MDQSNDPVIKAMHDSNMPPKPPSPPGPAMMSGPAPKPPIEATPMPEQKVKVPHMEMGKETKPSRMPGGAVGSPVLWLVIVLLLVNVIGFFAVYNAVSGLSEGTEKRNAVLGGKLDGMSAKLDVLVQKIQSDEDRINRMRQNLFDAGGTLQEKGDALMKEGEQRIAEGEKMKNDANGDQTKIDAGQALMDEGQRLKAEGEAMLTEGKNLQTQSGIPANK
ncbi:hypothetical protein FBR07_01275 [Candidatus Uhrbacteria bacterium UHB]|nr:hypothetical protein [Candidatus Uhrbacteria bacterium UHB]RIL01035.1 MAG: hypothetical protein DCC77_00640 [Candidatus Uhrbacteria bacterium]